MPAFPSQNPVRLHGPGVSKELKADQRDSMEGFSVVSLRSQYLDWHCCFQEDLLV